LAEIPHFVARNSSIFLWSGSLDILFDLATLPLFVPVCVGDGP
jgi:hypothetical protein